MLNGTALISVHLQFCFQRPDVPVWIFQVKEDLCSPVGWPVMIRSYLLIYYSCSSILWLLQERKQIRKTIRC